MRLKRLFYALRSALAARWIRERHACRRWNLRRCGRCYRRAFEAVANDAAGDQSARPTRKRRWPGPAALSHF
ncbi:MAG: hypothetical protein WKG07_47240 [Hymenobacter sp.]